VARALFACGRSRDVVAAIWPDGAVATAHIDPRVNLTQDVLLNCVVPAVVEEVCGREEHTPGGGPVFTGSYKRTQALLYLQYFTVAALDPSHSVLDPDALDAVYVAALLLLTRHDILYPAYARGGSTERPLVAACATMDAACRAFEPPDADAVLAAHAALPWADWDAEAQRDWVPAVLAAVAPPALAALCGTRGTARLLDPGPMPAPATGADVRALPVALVPALECAACFSVLEPRCVSTARRAALMTLVGASEYGNRAMGWMLARAVRAVVATAVDSARRRADGPAERPATAVADYADALARVVSLSAQ